MAGSMSEAQILSSIETPRVVEFEVESFNNLELHRDRTIFQDKAGAFFYKHNRRFSRTTRNRYIIWKVSENVIELNEISQDLHLYGNHLKIKVKDGNILPSICIHESRSFVYIVFATANSVHRICFNHPIEEKQATYISSSIEASASSIFNKTPTGTSTEPWCFAALPKQCHFMHSHQAESGECFVCLFTKEGSLLLVVLPAFNNQGQPQIHELKQTSMMKRLWSGLVPTALRGDNTQHDSVQSAVIQNFGKLSYIFALCKDLKIRIWSCQLLECIEEYDLTPSLPDIKDNQSAIAQAYTIRVAHDIDEDNHFLGVFLNFTYQSQFCVFEIFEDEGDVELGMVSSHFSKLTSLLDFQLTTKHIWAMWSTTSGDTIVQYAPIEEERGQETVWHSANLLPNENPHFFLQPSKEPKEVYLDSLFQPGKFSKNVLLKTIQMTIKSLDANIGMQVSMNSTMDEIRLAVENLMLFEMQSYAPDYEIGQDEYYELQRQCWSKFYASAVQYGQVDRKPLGLFADSASGHVGVIRQNYVGYLYSNSWIETLYNLEMESKSSLANFIQEKADIQDTGIADDIITLMDCVRGVSLQLSNDILHEVEAGLEANDDVMDIVDSIATCLLTDSEKNGVLVGDINSRTDYIRNIEMNLQKMENILSALSVIVDVLNPTKWLPEDFEKLNRDSEAFSVNPSHSFSSQVGRSILVESIYNRACLNMAICRDLLVLVNLISGLSAAARPNLGTLFPLKAEFAPKIHESLRCYFIIIWLGKTKLVPTDPNSMEASLKKFAALDLSDLNSCLWKSKRDGFSNSSLLSSFICNVGVPSALNVFGRLPPETGKDFKRSNVWLYDFKLLSDMIIRSLWPSQNGTQVPEFLLMQGQSMLLCQYLDMCNGWCDTNRGSRAFLMGQAHLQSGEPQKALEYFFKATKFIGQDEELLERLIPRDDVDKPQMIVSYLIKVMRLFEQFECPEMMILVAKTAVVIAKKTNPKDAAMLWSNIFKCYLELENYKEAYQAITLNPDKQRRRNCLNKFIVTLCERSHMQEICEFSYASMEDEVISIIETRARTVDITVNDYYDLLYAFHVFRSDFRRAATAMYEYACRLCTEVHGLASLQQQAKCYLAAMNCLHICDQKYAWIVRPADRPSSNILQNVSEAPNRSPKRTEDGEEIQINIGIKMKSTKKTVIVELADLEKEYLLILARLNLIQIDKSSTAIVGPSLSATETIALLTQAGLFDRAFSVATSFKLDLEPIFEGLAAKCVKVGNDVAQGTLNEETWNWLGANDLGTAQPIKDISAVEQAWRLLRKYVDDFTEIDGPIYYKPVAKKLLSLGCMLPVWLVGSYKRQNPAELLQVYINFDLLEEAHDLACEYVQAVLGHGKEYFGLKSALTATAPSVWLPYSAIDQLLTLLKARYEHPQLRKLYDGLQKQMGSYFQLVETASKDKLEITNRKQQILMERRS